MGSITPQFYLSCRRHQIVAFQFFSLCDQNQFANHNNPPNLVKMRKNHFKNNNFLFQHPTKPPSKSQRWITFEWDLSKEMDTFHLWTSFNETTKKIETKYEVMMISCQFWWISLRIIEIATMFDSDSINSCFKSLNFTCTTKKSNSSRAKTEIIEHWASPNRVK